MAIERRHWLAAGLALACGLALTPRGGLRGIVSLNVSVVLVALAAAALVLLIARAAFAGRPRHWWLPLLALCAGVLVAPPFAARSARAARRGVVVVLALALACFGLLTLTVLGRITLPSPLAQLVYTVFLASGALALAGLLPLAGLAGQQIWRRSRVQWCGLAISTSTVALVLTNQRALDALLLLLPQ